MVKAKAPKQKSDRPRKPVKPTAWMNFLKDFREKNGKKYANKPKDVMIDAGKCRKYQESSQI